MTPALPVEIVVFGGIFVYLVLLVPVFVITALKGRWTYFGLGFITCGIIWFVGAASRAAEGTWWADQFYADDPEPDSREFEELRSRRIKRTAGFLLLAVVLIGIPAARPAPFLGVDGESLQQSFGGTLFSPSCLERDDGDWTCFEYDDTISGDRPYRVTVDSLGCWEGRPAEGRFQEQVPYSETELSGCMRITSYL